MKAYTIQESIELLEKAVENGGGSGGASTAADVSYDNTSSGLTADDVQEAIDELNEKIPPAIAYSTTEHVIGTWLDGRDIYQKTLTVETAVAVTNDAWADVSAAFDSTIDADVLIGAEMHETVPIDPAGLRFRIVNNALSCASLIAVGSLYVGLIVTFKYVKALSTSKKKKGGK